MSEGDDQRLSAVESKQGQAIFSTGDFPPRQFVVVAPGLEFLVGEVFHRFEVHQAVDGARVAGRVSGVHLTHETGTPGGGPEGKHRVEEDRHKGNEGEGGAVVGQQYGHDNRDFQQRVGAAVVQ